MSNGDITVLLEKWSGGDQGALHDLAPLVYGEMKKLARIYLTRERSGHTLRATALVNEAYLKLVDQNNVQWKNRAHFFGIAAQAMRRILIDYAKAQHREKRGGGAPLLELDENVAIAGGRTLELIALDDALNALAKLDPRQSQLVELRYFGGLSIEEILEVMGISKATYHRYWDTARAFLALELSR